MILSTAQRPPIGRIIFYARKLVLLALASTLWSGHALAANNANTDKSQQIKAAFILNIARFAQWQNISKTNPDAKFVLCLYRDNSLQDGIDTIIGKTVNDQLLEAVTIDTIIPPNSCDSVLIDKHSLGIFQQTSANQDLSNILTILDHTDEITNREPTRGIVVSLVRRGSGIGLEIDLATAQRHKLSFSSEILRLATLVEAR